MEGGERREAWFLTVHPCVFLRSSSREKRFRKRSLSASIQRGNTTNRWQTGKEKKHETGKRAMPQGKFAGGHKPRKQISDRFTSQFRLRTHSSYSNPKSSVCSRFEAEEGSRNHAERDSVLPLLVVASSVVLPCCLTQWVWTARHCCVSRFDCKTIPPKLAVYWTTPGSTAKGRKKRSNVYSAMKSEIQNEQATHPKMHSAGSSRSRSATKPFLNLLFS